MASSKKLVLSVSGLNLDIHNPILLYNPALSFVSKDELSSCMCWIFRNVVTEQDAKDVVEIMKYSLHDTFSDENDSLVFSRSMHGSGVSGRGAAKKLIDILHQVCFL